VCAVLTSALKASVNSIHVETERPTPWEKRVCRRNELAGEFPVVVLNRIVSGKVPPCAHCSRVVIRWPDGATRTLHFLSSGTAAPGVSETTAVARRACAPRHQRVKCWAFQLMVAPPHRGAPSLPLSPHLAARAGLGSLIRIVQILKG
jgi:hypothetical protein